jgi:hypothetical protein
MEGEMAVAVDSVTNVHGIKTGLALVRVPQNAVGFAELRAYTFDTQGNPTLHRIDLTYDEADNLRRALESITGDRR